MVSVSRTLAQRQIQVNSILPGPMITGMTDDWSTEKREGIAGKPIWGDSANQKKSPQWFVFFSPRIAHTSRPLSLT